MRLPLLILLGILGTLAHRGKRQAATDIPKWPGKTLNYMFSRNLPLEFEALFRDAIRYISDHTCIKFHHDEARREKYSVKIKYDNKNQECFSLYGMQGKEQGLKFGYECAHFGNAVHELMHALGIFHEQARSDRDQYLVVDSSNHNFNREDNSYNPVPFDYGSVMLYPREDQSYPKDPEYNFTMGNPRVAFYDMLLINKYYECSCQGNPELQCQNGGYQNPAKCSQCICTPGFSGDLCQDTDGQVFTAMDYWQDGFYAQDNLRGFPRDSLVPERFFYVVAPPNKKIQIQLTNLDGFFCAYSCQFNGVEVKYKEDRRITSPMVCCDNDNLWNKTRTSIHNPTVIVQYGEDRGPKLGFRYRFVDDSVATADNEGLTDNKIH